MSEEKSFEEKLESAKKILEKLQDPQITLKESMELFKKGKEELTEASKMLQEAELEYKELLNNITDDEDNI